MKSLDHKNTVISMNPEIDNDLSFSKVDLEQYNAEILVSEIEIKSGKFYSHMEVENKIEQWKNKVML